MTMLKVVARHVVRPAARTKQQLTHCHLEELTAAFEFLMCRTTRWHARENARLPRRHCRIKLKGTLKNVSYLDDFSDALKVSTSFCRCDDRGENERNDARKTEFLRSGRTFQFISKRC